MEPIANSSFSVLHEEEDFLIVDKSPGVSMHSDGGVPGLIEQMRKSLNREALYPVHRLDKPTSGLLIVSKSHESTSVLSGLFQARDVEKIYVALSAKKPSKKMGLIKGDMAKARDGAWKLQRTLANPAVTEFKTFGMGVSNATGKTLSLFCIKPQTGKTHQIRVALKSLGSPILGDSLYSGEDADRTYLHAHALRFIYEGKTKEFTSFPSKGEEFISHLLLEKLGSIGNCFDLSWSVPKTSREGS